MVRNFKHEVDEKDLKPCPHCGSEPRTWKQGLVRFQLVKCSNDSCGSYFTKYTPHEWNRRKDYEALEKQNAALREERDKYKKALMKLRSRAYNKSEWGAYIDLVLLGKTNRHEEDEIYEADLEQALKGGE